MHLNYELEGIEAVFMDLDGTLYLGNNIIDGVNEFLTRLTNKGIKIGLIGDILNKNN